MIRRKKARRLSHVDNWVEKQVAGDAGDMHNIVSKICRRPMFALLVTHVFACSRTRRRQRPGRTPMRLRRRTFADPSFCMGAFGGPILFDQCAIIYIATSLVGGQFLAYFRRPPGDLSFGGLLCVFGDSGFLPGRRRRKACAFFFSAALGGEPCVTRHVVGTLNAKTMLLVPVHNKGDEHVTRRAQSTSTSIRCCADHEEIRRCASA